MITAEDAEDAEGRLGMITAEDAEDAEGRRAPDFTREVLAELYTYPRKRRLIAWPVWLVLGLAGGHRFYLERYGTAILMMLTGGGMMVWWIADAFLLHRMLREHDEEQARREREGLPPIALDFMPPLSDEALARPPAWAERWAQRSRRRRALRLAGDLCVLLFAGFTLGVLARATGTLEAVAAIVVLAGIAVLGGAGASLSGVPVAGALLRWSHRLRLFYAYNEPGSPPVLLLRGLIGPMIAPYRRRARAEVRLYLQLGVAFTIAFLVLDALEVVVLPFARAGAGAIDVGDMLGNWLADAMLTFIAIYAYAAPIGAVLTLYLLTRDTHRLPRALAVVTVAAVALGMLAYA